MRKHYVFTTKTEIGKIERLSWVLPWENNFNDEVGILFDIWYQSKEELVSYRTSVSGWPVLEKYKTVKSTFCL